MLITINFTIDEAFPQCESCARLSHHQMSRANPYEGEERWTIIGTSQDGRLLLYVVYTISKKGRTVRIISARPATKKKRRSYELG